MPPFLFFMAENILKIESNTEVRDQEVARVFLIPVFEIPV